MLIAFAGRGQDLEPRAYSAAPIGTNFVVGGYSHLKGEVLTDPAAPIQNVQAQFDVYLLGYARTFALAGQTASVAVAMPYARGDVSGDVFEQTREVHRAGIGDVRLRFGYNFRGSPALTPKEFMRREPGPVIGASLTVVAPTGQYVPSRLVNVGTNRWAFRPDVGMSFPVGNWFFEGSFGAWLYADNDDFFGGRRRSQDPLFVVQGHAGYNFRPGMWIALNGAVINGGRSTVNGIQNDDKQDNSRLGVTLSVPFATGWSVKAAWSRGFVTRAGGDYDVVTFAIQYRWFD